jgi:hypothetical protein
MSRLTKGHGRPARHDPTTLPGRPCPLDKPSPAASERGRRELDGNGIEPHPGHQGILRAAGYSIHHSTRGASGNTATRSCSGCRSRSSCELEARNTLTTDFTDTKSFRPIVEAASCRLSSWVKRQDSASTFCGPSARKPHPWNPCYPWSINLAGFQLPPLRTPDPLAGDRFPLYRHFL